MNSITVPAGFTANIESDPTISIAPFGGPGAGKTQLICSAPGPVGVIPLDKKTRFTIEKYIHDNPADRAKFILPTRDFIREARADLDTMKPSDSIKYYRDHVNDIKTATYSLYQNKAIRTIAVDTGTVLFRNMFFAQYGRTTKIMPRDRASVYQEFEDFMNGLQEKNLIVTHQMKEIWENDVNTGLMGPDGYKKLGHLVDTMLEMRSLKKPKKVGGVDVQKYYCKVFQSQSAPETEGSVLLVDDRITFAGIAMKLRPHSDVNFWL